MIGIGYALVGFAFWVWNDSATFFNNISGVNLQLLIAGVIGVDFCAVVFFMIFAGTMASAHLEFIIHNLTTLDDLHLGAGHAGRVNHVGKARSPYDFGIFFNLRALGFLNWRFWLPLASDNKYEGYFYPKFNESREFIPIKFENKVKCIKDGELVDMKDESEIITASKMSYEAFTIVAYQHQVSVKEWMKHGNKVEEDYMETEELI